ncbi:hypothetical protein NKW45_00640 [Acetobacter orientalis]|uniref:hypothetical protein n=1 Tax=Acetobacter orientalis TaxID=146474 RepID=UPI0020A3ACB3|nr:hypothetical protein [Acetobacter orientalis]MCP1220355.1 hypothetical protein [Acetobacter orientalis]
MLIEVVTNTGKVTSQVSKEPIAFLARELGITQQSAYSASSGAQRSPARLVTTCQRSSSSGLALTEQRDVRISGMISVSLFVAINGGGTPPFPACPEHPTGSHWTLLASDTNSVETKAIYFYENKREKFNK